MKKNTTTADMQVKHLQEDIKRLSGELAATEKLADYYADSYESAKKLMKYHTLVLVILNMVYQYTDADDMGRAIRTNINRYYKGLTSDLYLKDHPEILTQELMGVVCTRFMNIGYIRKAIKNIYSQFVLENVTNNNFIIVPDHYGKE